MATALQPSSTPPTDLEPSAHGPGVSPQRPEALAAPAGSPRVLVGADVDLTCELVEAFALDRAAHAAYSTASARAMTAAAEALGVVAARGEPIYGLTTGFGPLVRYAADACSLRQGSGLIAHLAAGMGPWTPAALTRATMLIRAHTLGRGFSGVDPDAARAWLALVNSGLSPAIPQVGSVGASGDLIPLAHAARVLTGEGEVLADAAAATPASTEPDDADPCERTPAWRDTVPASVALAAAGLTPCALSGRDALALVNGTAFMTAYAALALARAHRLIAHAERLTGWLYRLLGCRAQALDARLHAARGHAGQCRSAAAIAAEAERYGPYEDTSRPLQEVYSLRCAPQMLGAARENLEYARRMIETELAGVSDNPCVVARADGAPGEGGPAVLHGGNFQGQQIAFACDALNAALVQTALLAERQLDVLVNPELNGQAPLLLAWQPGATSGLAGGQITATAIVAEMRHHGGPVATSSMPTNGRNQDIVSMGTLAARAALGQTARLAHVMAFTALGAAQLTFLRVSGRARGRVTPRLPWLDTWTGLTHDRSLHRDATPLAARLLRPRGA